VRQWQWLIGISNWSASYSMAPHKQLPFMFSPYVKATQLDDAQRKSKSAIVATPKIEREPSK
jgi:hypothetical protein